MRFEFATATRILFGLGVLREVTSLAAEMGARPLVVSGKGVERVAPLLSLLAAGSLKPVSFVVAGEPTTNDVRQGVALARQNACDFVIGFGGGAAGSASTTATASGSASPPAGAGRSRPPTSARSCSRPRAAGAGRSPARSAAAWPGSG